MDNFVEEEEGEGAKGEERQFARFVSRSMVDWEQRPRNTVQSLATVFFHTFSSLAIFSTIVRSRMDTIGKFE